MEVIRLQTEYTDLPIYDYRHLCYCFDFLPHLFNRNFLLFHPYVVISVFVRERREGSVESLSHRDRTRQLSGNLSEHSHTSSSKVAAPHYLLSHYSDPSIQHYFVIILTSKVLRTHICAL
jgi:hypothetical protein